MIRVVVVDDSTAFRRIAVNFLATLEGVEVVAEAASGSEAIDLVRHFQPGLVLADVVMPWMNGFEVTRRIKRLPAPPRVVLFSLHDNDEYRRGALESGADAFLAKSELVTELKALLDRMFGPDAVPGSTP